MAIHHAASGELIDIRPLGDALKTEQTKALYKSQQLEVFRIVLLAGKSMPEHRVDGELTMQCLEGSIEFSVAGAAQLLRQGGLICLAGGVPHALKAVEDASVLVTLMLPGK
jgi:quercetin dioxygenase-like cupin family protein